jgi:hypothetical protein
MTAPAFQSTSVNSVAECLELMADGEMRVLLLDGRWMLTSTVDLRVARGVDANVALRLINSNYVAEQSRRCIAGSVAEYDLTAAGQAAADQMLDQ